MTRTRRGRVRPELESVTDDEVLEAIAQLRRRRQRITRAGVGAMVGLSASGLRDRHLRRGLSWGDYLAVISRGKSVTSPSLGDVDRPQDGDMPKQIVVPLTPDMARALQERATADRRDTRSQAAVELEIRLGLRSDPEPRAAAPTRTPGGTR